MKEKIISTVLVIMAVAMLTAAVINFMQGDVLKGVHDALMACLDVIIALVLMLQEFHLKTFDEQKPTWSEEDERMIVTIIGHLDRQKHYQMNTTNIEQCQDWLKSLKDRIQPKQKWSDEDEELYREALVAFASLYNEVDPAADWEKLYSWFKSLKGKIQPQPKQEWSEEDSVRLQRIIDFLWHNRKGDTDTIYQQEQDIDWLKSLKDGK